MLDADTDKGRIVAAALRLAAERPWRSVTLADIAEAAGVTLVAMRQNFGSKDAVITAFVHAVDDEMLRRLPPRTPGRASDQGHRDALFDVVMSRFDILQPYRAGLRSMTGGLPDPAHVAPFFASQRWMLEAAGIGSDGAQGAARVAGLATVYAAVFRTWLDDDDPGMARTMAALDRRLRRGEQALRRVEDVCAGITRLGGLIMPRVFGRRPHAASGAGDAAPATPGAGGPQAL